MRQESTLLDANHIEKVEAQLDAFVERRAREAKDSEKVAELWAKTEYEQPTRSRLVLRKRRRYWK